MMLLLSFFWLGRCRCFYIIYQATHKYTHIKSKKREATAAATTRNPLFSFSIFFFAVLAYLRNWTRFVMCLVPFKKGSASLEMRASFYYCCSEIIIFDIILILGPRSSSHSHRKNANKDTANRARIIICSIRLFRHFQLIPMKFV